MKYVLVYLTVLVFGCSGGSSENYTELQLLIYDAMILCMVDKGHISPEHSTYLTEAEVRERESIFRCGEVLAIACYQNGIIEIVTISVLGEDSYIEAFAHDNKHHVLYEIEGNPDPTHDRVGFWGICESREQLGL